MLFSGRNFPSWYTPNNFQGFRKEKRQKTKQNKTTQKKGVLFAQFQRSFILLPVPFRVSHLPCHNFPFLLRHFSLFFASLFPVCQQKFPSTLPPPPPACYATDSNTKAYLVSHLVKTSTSEKYLIAV